MEHKIMFSPDNGNDGYDSVRACIHNLFDDSDKGESCPIDKCDLSAVDGLPLAMSYCPTQKFENLYDTENALKAGTLFKDLDKPFCGKGHERRAVRR